MSGLCNAFTCHVYSVGFGFLFVINSDMHRKNGLRAEVIGDSLLTSVNEFENDEIMGP